MAYPVSKIVKINTFIEAGGLGFVDFGISCGMALSAELIGGKTWPVKTFKTMSGTTDLSEYFAETTETYRMLTRWWAAGGGDVLVYLRDESNDSVINSANDAYDKKWFFHHMWTKDAFTVESDALALGDWGDANGVYEWLATDDPKAADTSDTTSIAYKLLQKGNRFVSVGYRDATSMTTDASQIYCMNGLAALFSKVNYSGLRTAITGDFKSVNGVIGEDLTTTVYNGLEERKLTFFTQIVEGNQVDNSVSRNSWSMSSNGEFADDVINVAALESYLRVGLYNVFRKNKAVQLTQKGQQLQLTEASNIAKGFYDNGVLGSGMIPHPETGELEYCEYGYKIYTKAEDILKLADADKRKRKMYPINMRVNLARAGHSIVVDLTVQ